MVYVNGPQPIIILEFGEELLSNNSNICVIQSNRRWDQAAIADLKAQIQLQERVLYLHSGTSDVQIPTDDKSAQSEPTNDLSMHCDNCRFSALWLEDEPCRSCIISKAEQDIPSGWEPKEEKHDLSIRKL